MDEQTIDAEQTAQEWIQSFVRSVRSQQKLMMRRTASGRVAVLDINCRTLASGSSWNEVADKLKIKIAASPVG